MTKSDIINQHPVVKLTEKSGTVDAGGKPHNFVLTADKESISNYARSGDDLIISFADGNTVRINHFFASGHPISNLIFIDDNTTWLTDFSQSLTDNGDGILDTNVYYDEIKDQSGFSGSVLLGILGAAAAVGGIAAAASGGGGGGDHDDYVAPQPPKEPETPAPDAPKYSVINNNNPNNLLVVRNGGSLNDQTPLLSGKGGVGNTVRIYLDGYPVFTEIVKSDGTWQHELPALKDGTYTVKVTQTDSHGKTSVESLYTFVVDTVAPDAPTIAQALDNVSPDPVGGTGELKSGDYTNDSTPALTGKGEPGGIVRIYDNGANGERILVGQGVVDKDGNWNVETNKSLSDGHHTLTTTVTDAAGNESKGSDFDINIDTSKPSGIENFRVEDHYPEIMGPLPLTGGTTDDETPVFAGKVDKDASQIIIKLNGHEFIIDRDSVNESSILRSGGEKVFHDDGTFAFKLPEAYKLSNGNYNYEIYTKNRVGNESTHINGNFAFNRSVPPELDHDSLDVIDNAGAYTGSYKTWHQRNTDQLKVTDDDHAVFKGKLPNGYDPKMVDHINIYDGDDKIGEAKVNDDGTWQYNQEWSQGRHHLSAAIVNKYGTVGPRSNPDDFDFVLDLNQPGAPSINQVTDDQGHYHESGYPTNSNSFFLTGDGPANGKVILKLYDSDGNQVKNFKGEPLEWTADVSDTGSWSVETGDIGHLNPPLKDGEYNFRADAIDDKGTATTPSGTHTLDRDTQPPATPDAPKAEDDVGDKRGEITDNATTDDDTPTLSGNGKSGEVVNIYDNGQAEPIGQTVVGEDGKWTWTPTTPLESGEHSLTTTLTDAAGNKSAPSAPLKVTVDTSDVHVVIDGAHDDEGSIQDDIGNKGITDDRSPTLFGRGTKGQSVIITDENGKQYGPVTVDDNGNWQLELKDQAGYGQEVTHQYTATITNAAGNKETAQFELTIDTKAPDAPTIGKVIDNVGNDTTDGNRELHKGDTTDDSTPTFQGKGTPGDTIKLYDNGEVVGETIIKDDGTWSVTPKNPVNGSSNKHDFTVTETDPVGNESKPSDKFGLGFDFDPVPELGGSDEVDVYDDQGTITGSYRKGEWATREGLHGSTVVITDDTTPTLKGQLPQQLLNSGKISSINIYDNDTLLTKIPVSSDGHWEYTPTLATGNQHKFEVAYENKAGVEGARTSFPFILDSSPIGQTSIDSATVGEDRTDYTWDSPTKENLFHLNGKAPANSIVTVYLKNEHGDVVHTFNTTTSDGTGHWSLDADLSTVTTALRSANLADGRYSFVADARNDAGAVGAPSGDNWIDRDTSAPAKPDIISAEDHSGDKTGSITEGKTTDEDLPHLSGKGERNSVVTIYDNGAAIGTTTTDGKGDWSWTPDTKLTGKNHSLTTTVTDAAGNVSDHSDPLNFFLDTVKPDVKIDYAVDDYNKTAKHIGSGGATNDATPTLYGRGTAGQTITILDKTTGSSWTTVIGSDGNWQLQLPEQQQTGHEIEHEYIASLINAAGNKVESSFKLKIDTAAPDTPKIEKVIDNVGNDPTLYPDGSRELHTSDITDDSTPTFYGKGKSGDIIKLYNGKQLIGQSIVKDDGTWSVSPSKELTDNAESSPTKYTFHVTETDSVGNESAPSNPFDLYVDLTPPVLDDSTIKLVDNKEAFTGEYKDWVEIDDGNGGKIKLTNDDTPTFSGRTISSDTKSINIYDKVDGVLKLIGTVDVDTNGDWHWEPKTDETGHGLKNGYHEWIARPVDAAGNEGQATPAYRFMVDNTTPQGGLGSDVGLWDDEGKETGEFDGAQGSTPWHTNDANVKVTDDKTPEVKGKLPAGSDVTKVHIYIDDTLAAVADVDHDGNWSYTPKLSSGNHKIEARPADDAGNESTGHVWQFNIVGAAPSMPAITGIYNNSDPHSDEKFIDKNQFTNDATPVIRGTGDAGSFINIYVNNILVAQNIRVGNDRRWSVEIDPSIKNILPNGESWKIQASAYDAAIQESDRTAPWAINVDTLKPINTVAPTVTDHAGDKTGPVNSDETIDDRSPTISGKAAEGNVDVTIYDNGHAIATVHADGEGNWSYTPTNLSGTDHSITTRYTDKAGNISDESPALPFKIDTTNVEVSILYAVDDEGRIRDNIANTNSTDDNTPQLIGKTSPNTVVTIKEGDNVLATVTSDGFGNWSYQLPVQSNGAHTYTATVVGKNGNESSANFQINIDNTKPAAPVITRVEDDVPLDTDDLANGAKTNDTTPTFHGTGNNGDTITIYDQADDGTLTEIGKAVVSNGEWVITVNELSKGVHHFKLQATNKLGADSATMTDYQLTVQTDTPQQTATLVGITQDLGSSDHDFITSDNTLVFKFAVSAPLPAGYKVQAWVDGAWHDATLGEDGLWYYDHTAHALSNQVYSIMGRVVDDAGNVKVGPAQDVTIDTTAPTGGSYSITIDSFTDDVNESGGFKNRLSGEVTNDNTPILNGRTTGMTDGDYITVQVKINGEWVSIGTTTVDSSGNWKFALAGIPGGIAKDHLDDGYHEFRGVITDKAGNLGTASSGFGMDVQTTPPAPIDETKNLDLYDDQRPDVGTIRRGATTDDSRPTLSGSAQSVDPKKVESINLYDNGKLVGNAKVNSDGSWSVEAKLPLRQGAHEYVARPVDHAGNEQSQGTTPWQFYFQGHAPATPSIVDVVDDNNESIQKNAVTSDTAPAVKGTGTTGTTVYIYVDGNPDPVAHTDVKSDGTWEIAIPELSNPASDTHGTLHTIKARAQDKSGIWSHPTGEYPIIVDTIAPDAPNQPTATDDKGDTITTATDDPTPTLSGKIDDPQPGDKVIIYQDGIRAGEAHVNTDGTWTWTPKNPISNGAHKFTTSVTDAAGNESDKGPEKDFNVDTSKKAICIDYLIDDQAPIETHITNNGATDDTTPNIVGKASANSTVVLTYTDKNGNVHALGTVTADGEGNWSYQVTDSQKFAEGHYIINAEVTSASGKKSSAQFGFDVQLTNNHIPTITNIGDDVGAIQNDLSSGDVTDDTTPTIYGNNAIPFSKVNVYDTYEDGTAKLLGTVIADGDGHWNYTPTSPLPEGKHHFTAKTVDEVGNESTASSGYDVVVDITPPQPIDDDSLSVIDDVAKYPGDFTGKLTNGQYTNDNRPEYTGKAPLDAKQVNVYDNGQYIGSTTVNGDGTWSFTPPADKPLGEGKHTYTARPVDVSGNEGTDCQGTEFIVDTKAPNAIPSIAGVLTDTGASDHDFITSTNDPTILVNVDKPLNTDEHVEISLDGGVTWQRATYNRDTNQYYYSVQHGHELSDNTYDVRARVVDNAGNASREAQQYVVIDTKAPNDGYTVTINSYYDDVDENVGEFPDNSLTNDTSPLLKGKVTGAVDSDVINLYSVDDNGNRTLVARNIHLTKNADGTYNWQYQLTNLAEGKYSYVAVVADAAGNAGKESNVFHINVDVTPPVWGDSNNIIVYDDQQPVVGNIPHSGGQTDDNYPEVRAQPGTVSGAEGGTVVLYDNGKEIGRGVIRSDGSFSILPTKPITPGNHSFTLEAVDRAGNRASLKDSEGNDVKWDFNFSGHAPGTPTITNVIDNYNNPDGQPIYLQKGQSTDDPQPVLRGMGTVGTIVHIYCNNNKIGDVTVGKDGSWEFKVPNQYAFTDTSADKNGTGYAFTVQAEDANHTLSSMTGEYAVVYNNVFPEKPDVPTLTSDQSPNTGSISGTTVDSTPTVSGTVKNAKPHDKVNIYDNGNKIGETEVGTDGKWTWTPDTPLKEGDHKITTSVTNAAGNESPKSDETDVAVDTSSVAVSILYIVDNVEGKTGHIADGGITNDTTPELFGHSSANAKIDIYQDVNNIRTLIGSVVADNSGNWSFQWPDSNKLSDGNQKIVAVATAVNNTTAEDSFAINVDTQNNYVPTIDSATDDVGIVQSNSLGSGAVSDDTTPTLRGHGAEPNGWVNIYETRRDGQVHLIDTVRANSAGYWEYTVQSPLPEGEHKFFATSVDAAGNESGHSNEFDYTIDITAPNALDSNSLNLVDDVPEITGTINGFTNDNQPTYSGLANADTKKVYIYDKGVKIAEVDVVENNGTYTWSYTPPTALGDGTHEFQAKPVDSVGNIGPSTSSWEFTVATGDIAKTVQIDSITEDTGLSSTDFVTSDRQPTIYATVSQALNSDMGEKVQFNIGGQWYDASYDSNSGKYFFKPAVPLVGENDSGEFSVKARIIDNAGRTSALSSHFIVIDSTPPTGSITLDKIYDDVGLIEGEFKSGVHTDDRTPELRGTVQSAQGGDYIVIYLADEHGNILKDASGQPIKLGTTTPNGTNWSCQIHLDSANYPDDKSYYFVAVLEDSAGNQGPKSDSFNLWLSTQGPKWVIPNDPSDPHYIDPYNVFDDQAPDTGYLQNGAVTDDNTPTVRGVSGSLDPATVDRVLLYDGDPNDKNAKPIGSGIVKDDGSWSVEPSTPLMPGHHHFYVVPVNKAGVIGEKNAKEFDFDLIGNAPGTPSITQVLDDRDPNVAFPANQIQKNQITGDKSPTINGTGTKGATVNIFVDDADTPVRSVTVDDKGNWSCVLPDLSDGKHNIWVQGVDKQGTKSSPTAYYPIIVDTTAPNSTARPDITSDVDPTHGKIAGADTQTASTNDTTPTFSGKLEKWDTGDVVTVYDGDVAIGHTSVNSDGTWVWTPTTPMKEGDHKFTTTVKDVAGNESTKGLATTVTIGNTANNVTVDGAVDDQAPIMGNVANGGSTDDTTPELYGRAPNGSIVTVYSDNTKSTVLGQFNVGTDGKWNMVLPQQANGSHNFYVEAKDQSGTVIGHQDFALTIDRGAFAAPTITGVTDDVGLYQGTIAQNGYTDDTNPTITGTAPANSMVIIYSNGVELGRVYADKDGNWSYTTGAMLPEGHCSFTAVAQNSVGTISDKSNSYDINVDVTAPPQITDQIVQDNVLPNDNNGSAGPSIIKVEQDGVTNDATPIFSGTASTDAKVVRIYDNNKFIAEVPVNGDHTWSWEAQNRNSDQPLADGQHALTAHAVDAAGNEGPASKAQAFTVDTHVPTATAALESITDDTGFDNKDFITQDKQLLFTANVSGTITSTDRVQAFVNGAWQNMTYNSQNGKWELDWRNGPALDDGTYNIKTRVISSTGQTGGETTTKVIIDSDGSSQYATFDYFTNSKGDNKIFHSGDYVNDRTAILHGKLSGQLANLEDGAKIGIYRDHVLLGYVNKSDIAADGTFKFALPVNSLTDHHSYIYKMAIVSASGYVGDIHSSMEVRVDTTGSPNVPNYGASNQGPRDTSITQSVALDNNGEWQVVSNSNVWIFRNDGTTSNIYLNYQAGTANGNVGDYWFEPNYFGSYTMADYNHDGYIDIWTTKSRYSNGTTAAYVGTGDNQWNYIELPYQNMVNGQYIENHLGGIATLDINGDGYLDVIQGDSGTDSGSVFLNRGTSGPGTLTADQFIGLGKGFGPNQTPLMAGFMTDHHVSAVDLDNNGTIDFAGNGARAIDPNSNWDPLWYQLLTMKNDGTTKADGSNWSNGQSFPLVFPSYGNNSDDGFDKDTWGDTISMTWADYNGDGYMDLFLSKNRGTNPLESQIFYNTGDGSGNLRSAQKFGDYVDGRWSVAIDWDHDGKMDIIELPGMNGNAKDITWWHNSGRVDLSNNVIWDSATSTNQTYSIFGDKGGRLASADGDVIPKNVSGIYGASIVDYDWDGALDLTVQRDATQKSLILVNKNKVNYGESLHLRITDKDGANVFYNNTVQLYNSHGELVASQIINPQGGIGTSDNTGLVHFYGLKKDETYSVVLLRNTNGQSNDIGGLHQTGSGDHVNTIENYNSSWSGLKAVEADHAYILNGNRDNDVVTTGAGNGNAGTAGYRPGLVGTGYNDLFTAEAGSQSYSGGGGWHSDDSEKYWQSKGGADIVDFGKSDKGITVDLSQTGYQSTGFNNAKFNDIEGIYGSRYDDTLTGNNGDNIFDGRGGNDTYHLEKGGQDLLLFSLLQGQESDATGGNGSDTVYGFHVGPYGIAGNRSDIDTDSDRIDVKDLLIGYRADADGAAHFDSDNKANIDWGDNIKDFLSTRVENGNTIISIDRDGKNGSMQFTDLLTLNNVDTTLETLLANHQIIVG